MKGRKPLAYTLKSADRRWLQQIAGDGHVAHRIATRAQALLALDRGERLIGIAHWTGLGRTSLWHLGQRYEQRGREAIFDLPRSGRPPIFSLAAPGDDGAHCVYCFRGLRATLVPLGLSQFAAGGAGTRARPLYPLHPCGPHLG